MAKRQYTVEVEITAKDKAGKPITKLVKGAMTDLVKSGRAASLSLLEMAESLSKASKTDAARAALTQLKRVLDSGEMSFEDYRDAVDKTQMSFGLATPASKKLAGEINDLTNRLAKGEITADEYDRELRQLTKGLKNTDEATEKTSRGMKLMDGIMMHLGQQVVNFVQRLPGMVVDLVKVGAAAERQGSALDNLAISAGTSGAAITAAIQETSNFTIDRMTAMQVANRAMMLDVAKTPEQFERLTRVAVRLGQAMGLDAATAINDFVTAAGRQSIMIADNLGLTVKIGDATEVYADKLGKTVDELTDAERKQAFLNAMLESGEKKVSEMGESTGDTATMIEKLETAVAEAKLGFAEMVMGMVAGAAEAAGGVDSLALAIRQLPGVVEKTKAFEAVALDVSWRAQQIGLKALMNQMEEYGLLSAEEVKATEKRVHAVVGFIATEKEQEAQMKVMASIQVDYIQQLDVHRAKVDFLAREQAEMNATWQKSQVALDGVNAESTELAERLERIDEAVEEYNETWHAAEQIGAQAERGMADLADGLNETGSAASWAERNAMALAKSLEEIETASIVAASAALDMGMTWKTFFDRNEEQAADWVTKRENLETGHAERMQAIQDAGNTEMLAGEQARYDEEKRMLDESQAAMVEAQREKLGQMMLQSFEAWAKMKQIPADQMLEMRTNIAEEYGLIDSETAGAVRFMTGQWEQWATDTGLSTDDVIDNLGLYMEKTGLMAAEAGGHLDTHEKDMAIWREALIDDMSQVSDAMDEHKADPRAMADEVENDTRGMADDWVAWKDSVIEGTGTVKGEMDGLIIKSGDYSTATGIDTGAMTEDWLAYRDALGDDIAAVELAMDGAAVKTGEMATTSGEYLDDNSGDWQEWEGSIGQSTAETVSHMDEVAGGIHGVKNALADLPREVRIQLIIEQQGGIPGLQHGTSSFGGGLAMVGEAGPELVALPSGTQVWPTGSGPSRTTTNNYNMTVNTRAPVSTVVQDFETMAALMP